MATENNKIVVQHLIDAINQQDISAIDQIVSPKVAAEIRDALAWIAATWTDHRLKIVDMIAEEDQVWCRLASSGIHKGEWMGIAPTGKQWTNSGVGFLKFSAGRITEVVWFFDVFNHISQLGATFTTT